MKFNALVLSIAAILLFLAGILLQLAVSGGVLWGELEARVYTSQSSDFGMAVKCPIMLSFDETGTVSASITNSLDREVRPEVIAVISRPGGVQQISQVLVLDSHETKTVEQFVDHSNILFGRLILVSILQRRYSDLPARQGYCGILLLNILGMNGRYAFTLLFCASFIFLALGGALWRRTHSPLTRQDENTARASASLAIVGTMGLLSALPRWWGLIVLFDAIALMMIVVIFTEVLPIPNKRRS